MSFASFTRRLVLLPAAGFLLTMLPTSGLAADGAEEILSEDQVTIPGLKKMFQDAFLKCDIDQDGDVRIEEEGIKTYLRINREKKLITFFSIWHMKEDFSELEKLRLVNKLNDKLLLVRFCMPKPDSLWCDYQMSFDNGVYAYQIVATYRLFFKVVKGAAGSDYDEENILGEN